MFRESYAKRRCIIPSSGFFEWTGPKSDRTPHYFTAADGSPLMAFAGLWDIWIDPSNGEEVLSCTMVVRSANKWMGAFLDRMPMILRPEEFDGWLDGTLGKDDIEAPSEEMLREWTVSQRVNKSGTGDDDPTLVDPA